MPKQATIVPIKSKVIRTYLSLSQKLVIIDALRLVCHVDEHGTAIYAKGHSDESVAKSIAAFAVSTFNVKTIRKELFGPLPRGGNYKDVDPSLRIEKLEASVSNLDYFVRAMCSELKLDSARLLANYHEKEENGRN